MAGLQQERQNKHLLTRLAARELGLGGGRAAVRDWGILRELLLHSPSRQFRPSAQVVWQCCTAAAIAGTRVWWAGCECGRGGIRGGAAAGQDGGPHHGLLPGGGGAICQAATALDRRAVNCVNTPLMSQWAVDHLCEDMSGGQLIVWTVSAVPRWRDQLLEDGPLPPPLRPPLPLAAHTARLTVLRADNR